MSAKRQRRRQRRSGSVLVSKKWLTLCIRRLTFAKYCRHGEEPWYCDSCRYDWEKRVGKVREGLLQKAKDALARRGEAKGGV